MSLVYSGVPGLAVPGGNMPGLPYIPSSPPPSLPRGVVTITATGPSAAQAAFAPAGPLAAGVSVAEAGPLAATVTISQPS